VAVARLQVRQAGDQLLLARAGGDGVDAAGHQPDLLRQRAVAPAQHLQRPVQAPQRATSAKYASARVTRLSAWWSSVISRYSVITVQALVASLYNLKRGSDAARIVIYTEL
jgi:hypothetical protein